MAFKTIDQFNEERYGGFFQLKNDKDTADVIFLYQSKEQCLVASAHYLKSANYNGYVHCCGNGCPACQKGIRVQPKIFIPLFNITTGQVEFWDRTPKFEPQLQNDVFSKFPNPSEFIFRITRNGVANSIDTTYSIEAIAKNTVKSYAQILVDNNITMPDHYNTICKDLKAEEMQSMLVDTNKPLGDYAKAPGASMYGAVPRGTATQPASIPEPPAVAMPQYSAPPESIPGMPTDMSASEGAALGSYESLPSYGEQTPGTEQSTGEPVLTAPSPEIPVSEAPELDEEPQF